ncbi:F-box/LRR-repeat protein 17 [Desmophyllum pertusum]|uniref:F-box/LRR-repeat protein 17 n=1 Tax=Desmophyllum pertusum TaxID=174260 RepID=A0A9X0DBY4_9CNID|nr:F-box/LRR-repeat protein 17 [Desmophyllum pertusum]
MINTLADLVLAQIFGFLSEAERIRTVTLVCRKWYDVIHSSIVWKKVDFDFQRRITSDILRKFIYPGTREILLSKCHYLEWKDLCHILSRRRKLEVLVLAWISYKKQTVPADLTEVMRSLTLLRNSGSRWLGKHFLPKQRGSFRNMNPNEGLNAWRLRCEEMIK